MNSNYIKAVLSSYFRFKRQSENIATECGQFNADFLVVNNSALQEYEIKTSLADLKKDFLKRKHLKYQTGTGLWVPNEFYFAVPKELVKEAVALCAGKPYGVILIREDSVRDTKTYTKAYAKELMEKRRNVEIIEDLGRNIKFSYDFIIPWQDRTHYVKKATKLHTRPVNEKVKQVIHKRLASEMANLRQKISINS